MTETILPLSPFAASPLLPGLRGIYWAIPPLVIIAAVYFAGMYRIDAKRTSRRRERESSGFCELWRRRWCW